MSVCYVVREAAADGRREAVCGSWAAAARAADGATRATGRLHVVQPERIGAVR